MSSMSLGESWMELPQRQIEGLGISRVRHGTHPINFLHFSWSPTEASWIDMTMVYASRIGLMIHGKGTGRLEMWTNLHEIIMGCSSFSARSSGGIHLGNAVAFLTLGGSLHGLEFKSLKMREWQGARRRG